ncbi:MAG: VCBS repeat-containing protein, partial [Planctomycetes bacterium]|nr:VCBS repeat-containing protein [Planctomycetota bacterium]
MQLAGRVWVVPGAATGGFDEPRRIEVALESPGDLATADLDGDGLLDLAAGAGSPAVILLSGATIRRAGEVPVAARTLAVAGSPAALAAGDFDGDRFPDLAAACDSAGAVSYLRGAGIAGDQGAAAARKDIALAGSPTVLATGDLDGDGFLDLAAAGRGADHVTFIPGGPRGLEEASAVPAGRDPIALVAGELDGDGLLDLAAACAGSSFVSLLRGSDRGPS